jgi:hypothetical protein
MVCAAPKAIILPEWAVCFLQGFGDLVNASQVVEKIGAPHRVKMTLSLRHITPKPS